jgi:hypothetical protein
VLPAAPFEAPSRTWRSEVGHGGGPAACGDAPWLAPAAPDDAPAAGADVVWRDIEDWLDAEPDAAGPGLDELPQPVTATATVAQAAAQTVTRSTAEPGLPSANQPKRAIAPPRQAPSFSPPGRH